VAGLKEQLEQLGQPLRIALDAYNPNQNDPDLEDAIDV